MVFAIDEAEVVNGVEVQVAGTYNEYIGTVASGTSITNVDWALGSGDRNYASGALTRVYIPVSAERENRIVEWGLVHADQDGTLKAGAVDNAAVLADDVVETAKIKNGAVSTAKLADGSVTAAKTNFGGSGAGIWWEEIARVSAGSVLADLSTGTFPARKYLKLMFTGLASGGTYAFAVQFNNDAAANYADSALYQNGASAGYSVTGPRNNIRASTTIVTSGVFYFEADIATPNAGWTKLLTGKQVGEISGLSAGYAPDSQYFAGKWLNYSSQITSIQIVKVGGTSGMAAGSELIILGHD